MVPQPAPPFVEPSEAEKIVSSGKSIFLLYICCRSSLFFLFRPAADRANWCCIFLRPSPVAVAVCTHLVALFRLLRIRESPLGEISLSHGNASRESDRDATLTYSLTLTHCRLQHCFSSLAALFFGHTFTRDSHALSATFFRLQRLDYKCNWRCLTCCLFFAGFSLFLQRNWEQKTNSAEKPQRVVVGRGV